MASLPAFPFLPIGVTLSSLPGPPQLPEFLFLPNSKISFHACPAAPIKCSYPPELSLLYSTRSATSHHPCPQPTKASVASALLCSRGALGREPPTGGSAPVFSAPEVHQKEHRPTLWRTFPLRTPSLCPRTPFSGRRPLSRCGLRSSFSAGLDLLGAPGVVGADAQGGGPCSRESPPTGHNTLEGKVPGAFCSAGLNPTPSVQQAFVACLLYASF